MSAQVAVLREVLERRFPDAVPPLFRTARGVATGVAELDRLLPGGGLPRGRLSAWTAGVGTMALLRTACSAVLGDGERAAWIDPEGRAPAGIAASGVAVVRPRSAHHALDCAEELLRCGGFALVVSAGAVTDGAERVRLCRAAREGGSAWVEVGKNGFMAGLRMRCQVAPEGFRWQRNMLGEAIQLESVQVRVCATSLGWSGEVDVQMKVESDELRVSLESTLGDRRGSAHRNRNAADRRRTARERGSEWVDLG